MAIFSIKRLVKGRDATAKQPPTDLPPNHAPSTGPARLSNDGTLTVQCLQSSVEIPIRAITPTTTPIDILQSARGLLKQNTDPETSIVVECNSAFGLQRRLRRYEPIQDVLSSWERDSQNALRIVLGSAPDKIADLTLDSVPRSQSAPSSLVNVTLYHFIKPGKWNKKLVSLLGSGQIYAHKKADADPSARDSSVLCNLSDFDVYQVSERTTLQAMRPPKKYCFAIKSQFKRSVFVNKENYVHYFCTDDDKVAFSFQKCVQAWRSWYLVNKKLNLLASPAPVAPAQAQAVHVHGNAAQPRQSAEQHQRRISNPFTDRASEDSDRSYAVGRRMSVGQEKTKRLSTSTLNSNHSPPNARPGDSQNDVFSRTGLLGDNYDARKQHSASRLQETRQSLEGPFTGGFLQPPQDNNATVARRSSVVSRSGSTRKAPVPVVKMMSISPIDELAPISHTTHNGLSRSGTTAGLNNTVSHRRSFQNVPSLLQVDSTPKRSASQRSSYGRGVQAPTGAPLINLATNSNPPWHAPPVENNTGLFRSASRRSTNTSGGLRRSGSVSSSTAPDAGHEKRRSVTLQLSSSPPETQHYDQQYQYYHSAMDKKAKRASSGAAGPLINFAGSAQSWDPSLRPLELRS